MGRPGGWIAAATGRPGGAVAGPAAAGASGASPAVLGDDGVRRHERGRCRGGRHVAGRWDPVVPRVWRHAIFGFPATFGRYLSFAEREEIAVCRAYVYGVREIAGHPGRSLSTISRELRRNAGTRGGTLIYRAVIAQWHRDRRVSRPKAGGLIRNERLREYVQERLAGVTRTPSGDLVTARRRSREMAGTKRAARTGAGPPRGAQNRSLAGCRSISMMMSQCGSPTRRSTRWAS